MGSGRGLGGQCGAEPHQVSLAASPRTPLPFLLTVPGLLTSEHGDH